MCHTDCIPDSFEDGNANSDIYVKIEIPKYSLLQGNPDGTCSEELHIGNQVSLTGSSIRFDY